MKQENCSSWKSQAMSTHFSDPCLPFNRGPEPLILGIFSCLVYWLEEDYWEEDMSCLSRTQLSQGKGSGEFCVVYFFFCYAHYQLLCKCRALLCNVSQYFAHACCMCLCWHGNVHRLHRPTIWMACRNSSAGSQLDQSIILILRKRGMGMQVHAIHQSSHPRFTNLSLTLTKFALM